MGSITRSLSNNITTGGVILPAGITNDSVSAVTSFANASGGTLILLSTQTASNSATISFTTGLDSTYDAYEFHFINVKVATDGTDFRFQGSTNGGTNYGVTVTDTFFQAYHSESDTTTALEYATGRDIAQGTFDIILTNGVKNDADNAINGTLQIFNPSSTTYVKHYISRCSSNWDGVGEMDTYKGGYFNTTSAINAIQFKMGSGNIADGVFKLYGLKKS
jgi:hypothetical protein